MRALLMVDTASRFALLALALLLCMPGWVSARKDDIRTGNVQQLPSRQGRHLGVAAEDLIAINHNDRHHGLLHHLHDHDHEGPCGTPERSTQQRESFERRLFEFQAQREPNSSRRHRRGLNNNDPSIVIPVCFHVIRPENPENIGDVRDVLDNDLLQVQLDFLNQAFSSQSCCQSDEPWCQDSSKNELLCSIDTGIRFEMAILDAKATSREWSESLGTSPSTADSNACITRTRNNAWYTANILSTEENTMMATLRVGGASVLNIVYNDLRDSYGLADRLLGHALLPEFYPLFGDIDGVVMSMKGIVYPPDPETYKYTVSPSPARSRGSLLFVTFSHLLLQRHGR